MRPFMLDIEASAKSKSIINQEVLEEKFSGGLMEFEALIQSFNEDKKSELVNLLDQFTQA
jgi:hypothetical protein